MFILISGISGAGKTTLINRILKENKNFQYPKCITTRKQRDTDNNNQYIFVNPQQFLDYLKQEKLLEYQEYRGNYYGTLLDNYNNIKEQNLIAITEMGYNGIISVKKRIDDSVNVFIDVDLNLIFDRLTKRHESINTIKERLKDIEKEKNMLKNISDYIINNNGTINDMMEEFNRVLIKIRRNL